jgi:Fe-S-cluster-containing hydrogenase component 2/coenzyme F420-reducing hydrogenase delta subunit
MIDDVYAKRKPLRKLEKIWSNLEGWVNRIMGTTYNPLYHLDTLAIYLLIVITVTGIYLTVIYRPGAEVAYASVERISAHWLGSLMRSIHRYASDGFLLVTVIHGLKTFLGDRFSSARWLAWVSGWVMVIFSWAIGTMGYWLIWDERSQWMTELLIDSVGGGVAITFLSADINATSYAAFVIVLFVHIFLPIALLILIIVHVLRLMRPKIWSPKWLMIISLIALTLLSINSPVVSELPADLSTFIQNVKLDGWYLGFMPVLEAMGGVIFWSITIISFGIAFLLPWIAKGEQNGPAIVREAGCTGCALCATECPYRALEMVARDDENSKFKSIVVINESLCTGCGLCVGTCATVGIELIGMPTLDFYNNGIFAEVNTKVANNESPVVIFTCQRHASLGGVPDSMLNSKRVPSDGSDESPLYLGNWEYEGNSYPTVTGVVPCIGTIDLNWVKGLTKAGAKDVILLGCPSDDCNYREGVLWEGNRLRRRKSIQKPSLQWAETNPGNSSALEEMLVESTKTIQEKVAPVIENAIERKSINPRASISGILLLMFVGIFATALPLDFTSQSSLANESQLRILIEHSGIIRDAANTNTILPEGATVDASQILGGGRYPVHVKVFVDGELFGEQTFEAKGMRNEGEIVGIDTFNLSPGEYQVEIQINDNQSEWRIVYQDEIRIEASQIFTYTYDQDIDVFVLDYDAK